MYQQRISTSESPRVEVTACQGDLTVSAWDSSEVLIEVDNQDALTAEERDDAVALAANSDCRLTVPADALLTIIQVQGDLAVEGVGGTVEVSSAQGDAQFKRGHGSTSLSTLQGDLIVEAWTGPLNVGTVQGDAQIQQVNGPAEFGTVVGDLSAEEINGPLSALSVGGDAFLRQLRGALSADGIGADLIGREWMAGAEVTRVGGDVSLKSVFAGPHTYRIEAQGNIVVKVLPGSNATFILQAAEGRVRAKGLTGEMTEEGQWQGSIGAGEAQVTLISEHGSVSLKAVGEGDYAAFTVMADLGEIGATAGVAGAELAQRIQQRVAEKLSKIDFEAIARREAERARRQAERQADKARRAAERAQRKAERAHAHARRKKKVQWRLEWDTGRGARRPSRRSQSASEEERLAILRMLAEGKISADDAETLLQALES